MALKLAKMNVTVEVYGQRSTFQIDGVVLGISWEDAIEIAQEFANDQFPEAASDGEVNVMEINITEE